MNRNQRRIAARMGQPGAVPATSLATGVFGSALAVLQRSLAIGETAESRDLFAICAADLPPGADLAGIREPLRRALAEAWVRPAALARTAAAVLAADGPVAGDGLLRALLEATPVCDAALERWLTAMRASLLKAAGLAQPGTAPDGEEIAFWCALARQCFLNDYVFDLPADEAARAERLAEDLAAALAGGGAVAALWPIAVAAYRPLATLAEAPALLARAWPGPLAALCVQQVSEPQAEARLKAGIPHLTPIEDAVSLTVRRQYEDNPYPRWVKAAAPEPAIATFLAGNGLTFIGFDIGSAATRSYRAMFPDDPSMTDLGRWDQFESRHPGTFAGMYQFWVQKSGTG